MITPIGQPKIQDHGPAPAPHEQGADDATGFAALLFASQTAPATSSDSHEADGEPSPEERAAGGLDASVGGVVPAPPVGAPLPPVGAPPPSPEGPLNLHLRPNSMTLNGSPVTLLTPTRPPETAPPAAPAPEKPLPAAPTAVTGHTLANPALAAPDAALPQAARPPQTAAAQAATPDPAWANAQIEVATVPDALRAEALRRDATFSASALAETSRKARSSSPAPVKLSQVTREARAEKPQAPRAEALAREERREPAAREIPQEPAAPVGRQQGEAPAEQHAPAEATAPAAEAATAKPAAEPAEAPAVEPAPAATPTVGEPSRQSQAGGHATPDTRSVEAQSVSPIVELARDLGKRETRNIRVRLHPEELGQVDIRVSRDADGRLTALLWVERDATRQSLSGGIAHLREALERAGVTVDRLDVATTSGWDAGAGDGAARHERREAGPAGHDRAEAHPKATAGRRQEAADDRLLSIRA
jgi:flagellar hook-length control protein FliK